MPDPAKVSLPVDAGRRRAVLRELRQGPARAPLRRRGARSAAGCACTTTLDVGLQKLAREAIATRPPARIGADRVRSSRSTRTPARCSRWSAARTTTRTSSTSRRRASGSRARRSSRSCSRPRCEENISPSSVAHVVEAGDDQRRRAALAGEQLRGRVPRPDRPDEGDRRLRQLGLLAADGARRPAAGRAHGARSSASRRRSSGYFAIGLGAEPATPLEMARAYASFADGGKRIDGSIFGNEPRAVESVKTRQQRSTSTARCTSRVLSSNQARRDQPAAAGRRPVRHRHRRRSCPAVQVAGKTGTTENYGDAWFVGYTPQLVVAVWVGYPDKLVPMTYQFHGHAGRRRHVPGADLEGVHAEGDRVPEASRRRRSRPPTSPYASPVTVVNRGGLLERDNGVCKNTFAARVLRRRGAERDVADLQAERGRDPRRRRRRRSRTRSTRLDGQPLTPTVVYKPAKTGERIGYRRRAVPAPRARPRRTTRSR